MSGFAGIPAEALDFYEGLEADNSKPYWLDHKATYDTAVRAPVEALIAELLPLVAPDGEAKVFRPYKDARRAHGPLYKTHQGALVEVHPGIGYYVQVSAAGLQVAAGWHPQGAQLLRYREAVVAPTGAALDRLVEGLHAGGWRVDGGRELTRAPAGMSPDAPRIHLLRFRQLTVRRDLDWPDWVGTPAAVEEIAALWRDVASLVDWLADRVGPGTDSAAR